MPKPVLPEGTEFYFEDTSGASPEFVLVEHFQDLGGGLGDETAFVDTTPLSKKRKLYTPSEVKDGGERELKFNWLPDDPGQQKLKAAADAQETVNVEVRLPNNKKWPITLALSGQRLDGLSAGNAVTLIVKAAVNNSSAIA